MELKRSQETGSSIVFAMWKVSDKTEFYISGGKNVFFNK